MVFCPVWDQFASCRTSSSDPRQFYFYLSNTAATFWESFRGMDVINADGSARKSNHSHLTAVRIEENYLYSVIKILFFTSRRPQSFLYVTQMKCLIKQIFKRHRLHRDKSNDLTELTVLSSCGNVCRNFQRHNLIPLLICILFCTCSWDSL